MYTKLPIPTGDAVKEDEKTDPIKHYGNISPSLVIRAEVEEERKVTKLRNVILCLLKRCTVMRLAQ